VQDLLAPMMLLISLSLDFMFISAFRRSPLDPSHEWTIQITSSQPFRLPWKAKSMLKLQAIKMHRDPEVRNIFGLIFR
jgi:hypothetical protein